MGILVVLLVLATGSQAQTYDSVLNFDGTDGANPWYGSLVQGFDGNFYGTTNYGGANNDGTVFKMTPSGELTTLHSFCSEANCADGEFPQNGLLLASDGNFYGTTQYGASNCAVQSDCSTIFKITPDGQFTTLYTFCFTGVPCPDGEGASTLIQGRDGSLYGVTAFGGAYGNGTVFKMSTQGGTPTILYSFCAQSTCNDGSSPMAALVQASNGKLYGTTTYGGVCQPNSGSGTAFEITTTGKLTTLHSFCYPPEEQPILFGPLVQGRDGNLYGLTQNTVFKMTLAGKLTTLYTFCSLANCADGDLPYAGLIQGTDNNFYGTTSAGGANKGGTIYKINSAGNLTTLYSFCSDTNCTDGSGPLAALLQATNGKFYGTTTYGGAVTCSFSQCGNVYSLSMGLAPFVTPNPLSGQVGSNVTILGNNLDSAASVTFNGVSATFTVVSSSEITAVVPTGATTGRVKVQTQRGTLKSNAAFRVIK